jgi:peptidoglycan/LPS O-acetylase OafA/YrhL
MIDNRVQFDKWKNELLTISFENIVFSVDSFFLLGGLLASYGFMKQIKSKKVKLTWIYIVKFYLRRIWRISPTHMLVLLFSVGLTRYFIKGIGGFNINFIAIDNLKNIYFCIKVLILMTI